MNASLDRLVQNPPTDQFTLLEQHFKIWPDSSVNMLKQKGSFPYYYVDNFEKLEETQSPPRKKLTNSLQQYEVTVTDEECERAIEVFNLYRFISYVMIFLKISIIKCFILINIHLVSRPCIANISI